MKWEMRKYDIRQTIFHSFTLVKIILMSGHSDVYFNSFLFKLKELEIKKILLHFLCAELLRNLVYYSCAELKPFFITKKHLTNQHKKLNETKFKKKLSPQESWHSTWQYVSFAYKLSSPSVLLIFYFNPILNYSLLKFSN